MSDNRCSDHLPHAETFFTYLARHQHMHMATFQAQPSGILEADQGLRCFHQASRTYTTRALARGRDLPAGSPRLGSASSRLSPLTAVVTAGRQRGCRRLVAWDGPHVLPGLPRPGRGCLMPCSCPWCREGAGADADGSGVSHAGKGTLVAPHLHSVVSVAPAL